MKIGIFKQLTENAIWRTSQHTLFRFAWVISCFQCLIYIYLSFNPLRNIHGTQRVELVKKCHHYRYSMFRPLLVSIPFKLAPSKSLNNNLKNISRQKIHPIINKVKSIIRKLYIFTIKLYDHLGLISPLLGLISACHRPNSCRRACHVPSMVPR